MYYSGQTLGFLGDGLRALAIPMLVFKMTGSAFSTGLTYALEFLPDAVFGLVGGSLADRLDRRRLMIACDFTRFAVIGLFAVLFWRNALTLPVLYASIIVVSLAAAIFLGGEMPSIPYLVGKQRSGKAIAALLTTQQAVNVAAPPLGGLLFGLAGALPALVVNAFTYLTSQVSLTLVPSMGPDKPGQLPSLPEIWSDIIKGFRLRTWLRPSSSHSSRSSSGQAIPKSAPHMARSPSARSPARCWPARRCGNGRLGLQCSSRSCWTGSSSCR